MVFSEVFSTIFQSYLPGATAAATVVVVVVAGAAVASTTPGTPSGAATGPDVVSTGAGPAVV